MIGCCAEVDLILDSSVNFRILILFVKKWRLVNPLLTKGDGYGKIARSDEEGFGVKELQS